MTLRSLKWLAVGLTVAATAACGGSEPEPAATTTSTGSPAASAAKPASSGSPRVFFVEPADGATVKSPVKLRFGIENYELAAVPQGRGLHRLLTELGPDAVARTDAPGGSTVRVRMPRACAGKPAASSPAEHRVPRTKVRAMA